MKVKIDAVGRILIPKQFRDALALHPGADVDISFYQSGMTVLPGGRTAQIVEENGRLVGDASTRVTDETLYALIDSGRR